MIDIEKMAFLFNVKAKGYEEKCSIVRFIAKELGRDGIKEFGRLTGEDPRRLAQYATLRHFFKDKNRRRRQRKPKPRIKAGDLFAQKISNEVDRWILS